MSRADDLREQYPLTANALDYFYPPGQLSTWGGYARFWTNNGPPGKIGRELITAVCDGLREFKPDQLLHAATILGQTFEKDVFERRPRKINSPKQKKKWTHVLVGSVTCTPTEAAREGVRLLTAAAEEIRNAQTR